MQDAYSLRCAPQVLGAVADAIRFAEETVAVELNASTDNPLVFDDGDVISGGNFHGQPVAQALDLLAMTLTTLQAIAERRVERLVNPDLSQGLPAFLTDDPGLSSGFMMVQITAASLVAESRALAMPASIGSIPTDANQEDFVPMGMAAAWKAQRILANAQRVVAAELLCAAQGLEFLKPLTPGRGVGRSIGGSAGSRPAGSAAGGRPAARSRPGAPGPGGGPRGARSGGPFKPRRACLPGVWQPGIFRSLQALSPVPLLCPSRMNLEKLKDSARKFEQKEDWRKAIDVYLKAIQQIESGAETSPDLSLYNRVGDLYLKINDTASAVRSYERAVDLYADQGFFNNAIALCGKILRVNPGRTQTYLKLAQLHARKNVVIEAKRNLIEFLERMNALGQLDQAFQSVKEFADQFSGSQEIRMMLVELLRAASREEEALEQLAKIAGDLEAARPGAPGAGRRGVRRTRARDARGPATAPARRGGATWSSSTPASTRRPLRRPRVVAGPLIRPR